MIRHPRLVRLFSTSRLSRSVDEAAQPTPNLGSPLVQRKPLGAFRGGSVSTVSSIPAGVTEGVLLQRRRISLRILSCVNLCGLPFGG